MSSVNYRGFTWLDENAEHSDADEARAQALANKWSELHHEDEQRSFARMADVEDGRDDGYEPEECEVCGGDSFLGLDGKRSRHGELRTLGCGENNCPDMRYGIKCPNGDCVDGRDMGPVREAKQRQQVAEEERRLEVEIVEEKLQRLGVRMNRPYEHWNEDEKYVEYMEEGRFGLYSA